tara:strand:- start:17946 stop:18989 length:1044 start_codon:yes stop_codon:yes gene_type:complete
MLFSNLIDTLKEGGAGFIRSKIIKNREISACESIEKANQYELSFIEKDSYLIKALNTTKVTSILIPDDEDIISSANEKGIDWAAFEYPKIAFAESLEIIHPQNIPQPAIHSSAVIEDDVKMGNNIYIGANVYIGHNSEIGNNCIIHAGVVLYQEVILQSNVEIHSNSVIHSHSIIGHNSIINSNAVIGSEGFGFIPTKNGWRKMPQTGKVILEENVEIGSCSTIDRPAVGETRIGQGTKIDNLVQVGHGVSIGKSCAMASQVGIAGGAKIGNGVILAGQVGVANRVNVGDFVVASSKCGIHANIESGQKISGFPAISNKHWLRCAATFKKLPEIAKLLKKLNVERSS